MARCHGILPDRAPIGSEHSARDAPATANGSKHERGEGRTGTGPSRGQTDHLAVPQLHAHIRPATFFQENASWYVRL
ncbi:MAG: hypothetical protein M0027_14165 [Candidatus Dormibacteraeota bacterium]|nr:hypothetical protein [Candidatus Dormibacteraeota bacterium]